jgi:hypothetical protein
MHDPVTLQVLWDEPDIELRLMKALSVLTDTALQPAVGNQIDPAALRRIGEWYSSRCDDIASGAIDVRHI